MLLCRGDGVKSKGERKGKKKIRITRCLDNFSQEYFNELIVGMVCRIPTGMSEVRSGSEFVEDEQTSGSNLQNSIKRFSVQNSTVCVGNILCIRVAAKHDGFGCLIDPTREFWQVQLQTRIDIFDELIF